MNAQRSRSIATFTLLLTCGLAAPVLAQSPHLVTPQEMVRTDPATGKSPTSPSTVPLAFAVSTRAGYLNYAQGDISIKRAGDADWKDPVRNQSLDKGDRLQTARGRAEILLSPGAFLRVSSDSEIELTDPVFESLTVTVTRGTAMIEVTGNARVFVNLRVVTPRGAFTITGGGRYRINAAPSPGRADLIVPLGTATLDGQPATTVTGPQSLRLSGGIPVVQSTHEEREAPEDLFETWNQRRSDEISAGNARLRNQSDLLREALTLYRETGAHGFGRSPYFGIWLFEPITRAYTFFPFYSGWQTGYGHYLFTDYGIPLNAEQSPLPPVIAGQPTPPDRAFPSIDEVSRQYHAGLGQISRKKTEGKNAAITLFRDPESTNPYARRQPLTFILENPQYQSSGQSEAARDPRLIDLPPNVPPLLRAVSTPPSEPPVKQQVIPADAEDSRILLQSTDESWKQQPGDLPQALVISARAGYINLLHGNASVLPAGTTEWKPTTRNQRLKTGDRFRTEADGRAEILLNPGSYLRLNSNSEIVVTDPVLQSLTLTIARGTAILEVTGHKDTRVLARIVTPTGAFTIRRAGLYRVDVSPTGTTEIAVRTGEITLEGAKPRTVKRKSKVTLTNTASQVAKLDPSAPDDEFDLWNNLRSNQLALANERLAMYWEQLNAAIGRYRSSGAYGYGNSPYFGLWLFEPGTGCYTFFPFYRNWYNGYGSCSYSSSYGIPWDRHNCPAPPPPPPPVDNRVVGSRNPAAPTGGSVEPPSGGNFQTRPKFPGTGNGGNTLPNGDAQARPKPAGDGPTGDSQLRPLPTARRFPSELEITRMRERARRDESSDERSNDRDIFRDSSNNSGGDRSYSEPSRPERSDSSPNSGSQNTAGDSPSKPDATPAAAPSTPVPTAIPK